MTPDNFSYASSSSLHPSPLFQPSYPSAISISVTPNVWHKIYALQKGLKLTFVTFYLVVNPLKTLKKNMAEAANEAVLKGSQAIFLKRIIHFISQCY